MLDASAPAATGKPAGVWRVCTAVCTGKAEPTAICASLQAPKPWRICLERDVAGVLVGSSSSRGNEEFTMMELQGTTEHTLSESRCAPRGSLNYNDLAIRDDRLSVVRRAIYHSDNPGYYIFPKFITEQYVDHLLSMWSELRQAPQLTHRPFKGKAFIRPGCPNFYRTDEAGNISFMNFVWNRPPDECALAVCFIVQMLRARVEGRAPYFELYAHGERAVSYRVAMTWSGDVVVPLHRDYATPETYDPQRTQATLFLTKYGRDYDGDGFVFETNGGERIAFGKDVPVEPGDLILWRYNNEHGVLNVKTTAGQRGFARMIFPPEKMASRAGPVARVKAAVRANAVLRKYVRPLYIRLEAAKHGRG